MARQRKKGRDIVLKRFNNLIYKWSRHGSKQESLGVRAGGVGEAG